MIQPEGGLHNTPSSTFSFRYGTVNHPVVAKACHSTPLSPMTATRAIRTYAPAAIADAAFVRGCRKLIAVARGKSQSGHRSFSESRFGPLAPTNE
jgi:hypothetical protein